MRTRLLVLSFAVVVFAALILLPGGMPLSSTIFAQQQGAGAQAGTPPAGAPQPAQGQQGGRGGRGGGGGRGNTPTFAGPPAGIPVIRAADDPS
jgi:hypothetical protein